MYPIVELVAWTPNGELTSVEVHSSEQGVKFVYKEKQGKTQFSVDTEQLLAVLEMMLKIRGK